MATGDRLSLGTGLRIKKKKKSLFVHFQGHPEYGAQTLAKEYRRDVKRYLRAERQTYPTMPFGYFDEAAASLLNDFRENAVANRREEIMGSFPESVVETPSRSWESSAMCVYHNWLQFLMSQTEQSAFVPTGVFQRQTERKQSAVS